MSIDPRELIEKRNKALAVAREINEKAVGEGRDMNTEERSAHDKAIAEYRSLTEGKKNAETLAKMQAEIDAEAESFAVETRGKVQPEATEVTFNRSDVEKRKQFIDYCMEKRSNFVGDHTAGGSHVAPQLFVNEVLNTLGKEVFVRQFARLYKADVQSFGVPTITSRPTVGKVGEKAIAPVTKMGTGKRELVPQALAATCTVSRKLLRLATQFERDLIDNMALAFAEQEEEQYMIGSGAGEALGVFTPSDHGISTSRNVDIGAAINMDKFIEGRWKLRSGYRKNAIWVFSPEVAAAIGQLREGSGTGAYLWQPSKALGEPDLFMGHPVYTSEFAPIALTGSGNYVAVLGDFSRYVIGESLSFEVQRLNEAYSATNEVGFQGRMEVDGMPADELAFVRFKISA